jgi:hypothetical protein
LVDLILGLCKCPDEGVVTDIDRLIIGRCKHFIDLLSCADEREVADVNLLFSGLVSGEDISDLLSCADEREVADIDRLRVQGVVDYGP